jgi:transcriptional regulator with XRE-family HTH domain
MSGQDDDGQENLSIGEQLRRAREAKGLSLDDVASRTRIPIRHLQNIEREDWDALPAATYAVGFTRNYANALGLDGATLARALRDRIGGPSHRAAAPEYYAQADPARVPPKSLVFAAIFLAILIGAYLVWRSTLDDGRGAPPALDIPVAPAPGPAPAAPAAPSPQAAAGQSVTLVATGEAWVRISESESGATIFQGTMATGDRYQLPAAARHPVIHTGRPQNLRALVGAADLGPLAPTEQTIQNVSLRPEDLTARARAAPAAAAPPPAAAATPPAAPLSVPPAQ